MNTSIGSLELCTLNGLRMWEVWVRYSKLFAEGLFTAGIPQHIFRAIAQLHHDSPGRDHKCREIFILMVDGKSDDSRMEYKAVVKRMRRVGMNILDPDPLVREFLRKRILQQALVAVAPELSQPGAFRIDLLKNAITQAEMLDGNMREYYDYLQDHQRLTTRDAAGVNTPLRGIALFPGEVGVWVGPPKRGKTWALINTAFPVLIAGGTVHHHSLEISAHWTGLRYDARALGKAIRDFTEADVKEATKRIQKCGGKLLISDRPYVHVSDIREFIIQHGKPDLVIVDYADLLIPPKQYKERRFELRSTYHDLRALAKEFNLPVWTASQSRADAMRKPLLELMDMEEAKIAKAGTASLVLGINQSLEEREESMARINVMACSRYVPGKIVRVVEADLDRMLMKEIVGPS